MRDDPRLRVAVFRPDDDRLSTAIEFLTALGADPVPDPMLTVEPTVNRPRPPDYVDYTRTTAVPDAAGERPAAETGTAADDAAADRWTPHGETVVAIGESTADALRARDYPVEVVPGEFSSAGLVSALAGEVAGARVELARSDHGSDVLVDGLEDAGATVTETVLYRLTRPPESGASTELAAEGDLDAALFTSSLTVEHFLAAAAERGVSRDAVSGLNGAVVGTIGEPTRETATAAGIDVDVVPDTADFERLAAAVVEEAAPTYRG
jgi:uroporphyrinogen-III synthase